MLGGMLMLFSVAIAYTQNESFAHHVDITVNPELLDEETEFAQASGFDDGNRMTIFLKESVKLVNDPIFGAGLFHRGFGGVGLDPNGSHNFFLQMFLETGLVGGGIILALFYRLWMTSGPQPGRSNEQLGVRAAIVAGVVSSCTGEYFYGGVVLFYLFALVGPALEGLAPEGTPTEAGDEHVLGATVDA
jgi:hypothetical protein